MELRKGTFAWGAKNIFYDIKSPNKLNSDFYPKKSFPELIQRKKVPTKIALQFLLSLCLLLYHMLIAYHIVVEVYSIVVVEEKNRNEPLLSNKARTIFHRLSSGASSNYDFLRIFKLIIMILITHTHRAARTVCRIIDDVAVSNKKLCVPFLAKTFKYTQSAVDLSL